MGSSVSIVLKFIDTINSGDSRGLIALQTEDFMFIDMDGNKYVGRDGWENYFRDYPDYRIHVERILLSGDDVAILGKTTGSHVASSLEVLENVLWIAEVRDGKVSSWRIYSDLVEAKKRLGVE
jgi:ketosteroid isomerase-like protein